MAKIKPPWTPEQVAALNRWQARNDVHEFTCGGDKGDAAHLEYASAHRVARGQLIASTNGWFCPVCSYTQKWAHDFMCEPVEIADTYPGWRGAVQPCDTCGKPVAVNAVSPSECFCSRECAYKAHGMDEFL